MNKPEATVKEMEKKIKKIEDTLYGSKNIVSRITSLINTLHRKLDTLVVIGYILITLLVIEIFLVLV